MTEGHERWLLVYDLLRNGGIETLIVRLANRLAASGKDVAIVCRDGGLVQLLSKDIRLVDAVNLAAIRKGARAWLVAQADPVAMVSFDPISTAYGLSIETMGGALPAITHVAGIYHQRAYFMTGERRDRIMLNRLVAAGVGLDRLYFQNAECRQAHECKWRVLLDGSPIVPLGVEVREPIWEPSRVKVLNLVSVGRLVDFKAYNLGAAEIVRDCLDRGVRLSWDIYGTGPLASAMNEEIAKQGLADAVRLKGELPYPRFAETVAAHDLFIGCGTAALEAAMLGVPVLSVTDSERRATYGWFDRLPFGNTGELQEKPPAYDLADLIAAYAGMETAERKRLGERSREAALGYGLPAMSERLEAMVSSAGPAPPIWFKRLVSLVYDAATASPAARLARRLKARLGT